MDKVTSNVSNEQVKRTLPGATGNEVEFFALRDKKKVKFIQNGRIREFGHLSGNPLKLVIDDYNQNKPAQNILRNIYPDVGYKRLIELYVYYCYGSLDQTPDILNGQLSRKENFRESTDCIGLNFKSLRIDGQELRKREVIMIDGFFKDKCDKQVADELNIAVPTFDQHKRKLLQKAGVMTKTALMIKAAQQNLAI